MGITKGHIIFTYIHVCVPPRPRAYSNISFVWAAESPPPNEMVLKNDTTSLSKGDNKNRVLHDKYFKTRLGL